MNTAQLQHQIISNSQGLPKKLLEEVLDFIQFLKIKRDKSTADKIGGLLSSMNTGSEQYFLDELDDYKSVHPAE